MAVIVSIFFITPPCFHWWLFIEIIMNGVLCRGDFVVVGEHEKQELLVKLVED